MSGHSSPARQAYPPSRPAASLRVLSDQALQSRLQDLIRQERENVADIVEHLMEVDRREAALDWGYSSLFAYCVEALGYSEQAAYSRIRAARAATTFPELLDRLRSGRIHLDAVARLSPYLTSENNAALLEMADGASKRQVMSMVASLQTAAPPERDIVVPVAPARRDLQPSSSAAPAWPTPQSPSQKPAAGDSQSAGSPAPEVLAPPQHRFHFTAGDELLSLVERLRSFLRHQYPYGRLEDIFMEACRTLLERLEHRRRPTVRKPDPPPAGPEALRRRRVPSPVKREVWARDGGKCAYVSPDGRRCESRDALEFDHRVPWADGGRSDRAENIRLLCRAHNLRLARKMSRTSSSA